MLQPDVVARQNAILQQAHEADIRHLGEQLARRGADLDHVIEAVRQFEVAIPSWALGTGGTRFGRFPGAGEPRDIYEKMEDIAVIQQLMRTCGKVSLHIPWDEPDDAAALKAHAGLLGLGFDAVNSNTFQDQAGQAHSYKFGSLCHTSADVRHQAIEHHLHVIEVGKTLGSDAITVWLADGSNYPGQAHLRKSFERTLDGLQTLYAGLPADWRLFTEHKPYEPAFYSTVVQDWGSSYLLASALGQRAFCLVDLGHHLPNANIEQIVARLIGAGKLGGFHFNDSKYGDDDLTTGSIRPYQLFLVFNELVDAARDRVPNFKPAYMIDQSHNLKDPIEALLQSVQELQRAYAKAQLVDREALDGYQESNDALMAEMTLKAAFETDVRPLIAEARRRNGGALDPIRTFRHSGYREAVAESRYTAAYMPPQSL
ncbi:MAG: L-rhamnose catabolism isomerase [Rhodothermales bacterium]|nr:L-rhamnose catabolism isomerase [Rhodothermales bacterium]